MDLAPDKVILVHPMDSFFPDQGGGIRYLMNFLHQLISSGSRVTVIGMQSEPQPPKRGWRQIALIRRNNYLSGWVPYWVRYLLALYVRLPFMSIAPDAVVVAHRMDCMLAFVLFKPRNPKVLLSATPAYYLRINHPVLYQYIGWLYHFAERVCVSGVDYIVPTDAKTRCYYEEKHPKAPMTESVPAPVDFSNFRQIDPQVARSLLNWPPDAPVVLFVGRLSKVKNIPFLLQAFKQVQAVIPDARLYIVGDGEERNAIHKLALHLGNGVVLVGSVPPQEIHNYYAAANLLALCSLEEGSPTVVKEALACGTPVASTDVGDVVEVLRSGDDLGILVKPEEMSLANSIIERLSMPVDDAKREQRRDAVARYSTEKTGEKLIRICNQALDKKNSVRRRVYE